MIVCANDQFMAAWLEIGKVYWASCTFLQITQNDTC